MKKLGMITLMVLVILETHSVLAQSRCWSCYNCNDSGIYGPPGSPPVLPTFQWTDHFRALTRFGYQWMPAFGNGDSWTNAIQGPHPFGDSSWNLHPYQSDGLREAFYVLRDPQTNTATFQELYSPQELDHMDSDSRTEGSQFGYHWEFTIGNAYTTGSIPGTSPIKRYFNSSIFDHRTSASVPPGYVNDRTFDLASGTPRYAYTRFNSCLDRDSVSRDSESYIDYLDNGYYHVKFNRIWGNAISQVTVTNIQLVTDNDLGSLIQSALWLSMQPLIVNPTEAGGADVAWYANTLLWAGSPVLSVQHAGTQQSPSLISVVRPLNFDNDIAVTSSGLATDQNSPLLWRGTFRKTTTLGMTINSVLYNDVLKMRFEPAADADAPPGVYNTPYDSQQVYYFGNGTGPHLNVTEEDLVNLQDGSYVPYTVKNSPSCDPNNPASGFVCCYNNPVLGLLCDARITDTTHTFMTTGTANGSSLTVGFLHVNNPTQEAFINDTSQYGPNSSLIYNSNSYISLSPGAYSHFDDTLMVVNSKSVVAQRLSQIYQCHLRGQC